MTCRAVFLVVLLAAFVPRLAAAVPLELTGEAVQGGLIIGKTHWAASVRLDDADVRVSPDGHFLIGFGRDARGSRTLLVRGRDGSIETRTFEIRSRTYDVQRIDGLPQHQVTPPDDDLRRIRAEADSIAAAREVSTDEALFASGFVWPADGIVTGVYGSQRILNGEPRRPHLGLDIAGPVGTPVRAAASGRIVFVHPGMYFNGKTLVIDHGLGLNSIYVHLSETAVSSGERVEQGQVVGRIGATGRVTGAHLHWALQLGETPLDPMLVLPERESPARH